MVPGNPPLNKKPASSERVFLRIPLDIDGEMFINGIPHKKIRIKDLSMGGIGFLTEGSYDIPEEFQLIFSLPGFSEKVEVDLRRRNRTVVDGGCRVGGVFDKKNSTGKKSIENYVMSQMDLTGPLRAVDIAALLLCFDAAWRIIYILMDGLSRGTSFSQELALPPVPSGYFFIVAGCFLAGFSCLFITEDVRKEIFEVRAFLLFPGLLFAAVKIIYYWRLRISENFLWPINAAVVYETVLFFVIAFGIGMGTRLIKKRRHILKYMFSHQEGLKNRGC
ncbi:MAG: PilZ domain-containing protein [Candidatus Omnitrophota bacterium]